MFGTLNQYDNVEYMKQHRDIHIYTLTEKHDYKVCAIVIYDDRYITYTYNDMIEADRAAYLRSLQNRRLLIAVEQGDEEPDVKIILPTANAQTEFAATTADPE